LPVTKSAGANGTTTIPIRRVVKPPPAWIKPQLAKLVENAPDGPDWLQERKRPVLAVISRRPRWWETDNNPRHQFGDAVDRMPGGDLGKGVGEVGFRVHTVQFRGLQVM
jgi:hypothetical protein